MLFALLDYRRYRNRTGRYARDIRKSVMGGAFEGSLPKKAFELLKPGDMLLVQTLESRLSWLIMYLTSSEISHAAFYLGERKIAHATLSGVRVEPIEVLLDSSSRILPATLPIPADKRSEILEQVRGYIGLPYGWTSVLLKGARILCGRDWPYFRWRFFADICAFLVLLDLPFLVALHRPVVTCIAPVYLATVLVCALLWRWKPLKFEGWTGKPCDLLHVVESGGGSLMFDAYSVHQQCRANTPNGTTMPGPNIDGLPHDIHESVSRCFEELDNVIHEQTERQKKLIVPPMLYHYTDGTGLFGVIESGTIRLSDIYGLNDPSEVRHGLEIACGLLEFHSKSGHPAAGLFARQFRETMQGHLEKFARFFVACFSRNGDDLGQWRAYAANGHGFALGFDGPLLEQVFISRGDERNTTIHVHYDDTALRQVMERLVRAVVSILSLPANRKLGDSLIKEFITNVGTYLGLAAVHAAILYKHEGYKNEEEYRFLHVRGFADPITDLKRRARGSRIIHFDEFDWKARCPQALRQIVIGPAADEAAARSFISNCLTTNGLKPDTVKVTRSAIPYRG